jgi:hypothetical protein
MALKNWVRLPSSWIDRGGLKHLRWEAGGRGSDNIAALMALATIAHSADERSGVTRLSYNELCATAGLSRAKLSNGLDVLEKIGVVKRAPEGRGSYKLIDYDPEQGWAKLPARGMYSGGRIRAFDDFALRRITELNALKLFFLFVARRDRQTNLANISYDKIQQYTEIERHQIKPAISLLASLSLVYVEHVPSSINENGIANAYRIVGVDSYNHMGTSGRSMTDWDLE